ncbi:MAG: thermonuclease family protein [Cyanobacteria bacterium P01_D01_bin.73]
MRFPVGAIAGVAVCLGLVACQSSPSLERSPQAEVMQVIDGHTLEVRRLDQVNAIPEKVRLLGIDAPRLKQTPWGPESQLQLSQRVIGKTVRLEFTNPSRDRYNRLLAYVWQGDTLVNVALVSDGHALVSQQANGSVYEQQLRHAQAEARTLEVGIWNPAQPMRTTPAQFRQDNLP